MDSSRLSARRHGSRRAVRTLKLATAAALGLGLAAGVLGSSLPAQAQGAAPAQAAHAVVHRAAFTAATKAMPFRWDNGAQVKATVVTAAQAKVLKGTTLSGYRASAREWASTQRVLPDGRVVGVTGGIVKVKERGGSVRNYYSGTLKAEITYISVQGSTVYAIGMVKGGVNLYVLKGTASKPSAKTFLPTENQWANPVLVGGKVYYDRYLFKNHAVIGAEVVSVPLYGSKATVLVKNARDVQLLNGQLVYSALRPSTDHWYGGELTALKRLSDGKVLLSSTQKLWPWAKWIDDAVSSLSASPNASIAIADNVGGNGQLIMDLKNRKAWLVQPPTGTYATAGVASGSRVTWTWSRPFNHGDPGYKVVPVFDAATGKYTIYTSNSRAWLSDINGKALFYETITTANTTSYASGLIR